VALLRGQAELRADPLPEVGLTHDPRDDFIVALARATRADCIVSGDDHLTGLPNPDPPVFTPAQFVKLVADREGSESIQ
jgi:predicted nucleic acid-binding protein